MTGPIRRKKAVWNQITLLFYIGAAAFVLHYVDERLNDLTVPPYAPFLMASFIAFPILTAPWQTGMALAVGTWMSMTSYLNHIEPWITEDFTGGLVTGLIFGAAGLLMIGVGLKLSRTEGKNTSALLIGLAVGILLSLPSLLFGIGKY